MDISQAYAGYSYREGVTRAHVAWDVTALSVDDTKTWMKTAVPEPFRRGNSALLPSRGLVIAAVTKDPKTNEQARRLVIFSP